MKGLKLWLSDDAPHFNDLHEVWTQVASEKDYGSGILDRPEGDIVWPHPQAPFIPWGKVAQLVFKNGFGLSVIRTYGSNGGDKGKYEAGVLRKKTQREYDRDVQKWGDIRDEISWYTLTFDTPIIEIDVAGWLTEDEVTEYLFRTWAMSEDGNENA